jgi:dCTP deaminase
MTKEGILPSQAIHALLKQKALRGTDVAKHIQPNSIDLVLGKKAYRVRSVRTPRAGESVAAVIAEQSIATIDLTKPVIFEREAGYIVELELKLALPPSVAAHADSKSSTGRLDVQSRLLADGVSQYDTVPTGYTGKLYLYVCSNSFLIRVQNGLCLSQLQFTTGRYVLGDDELMEHLERNDIILVDGERVSQERQRILNGAPLHLDIRGSIAGYRARRTNAVVDLTRNDNPAREFWEPVNAHGGRITLEKGEFYILSTREGIRTPPHVCAYLPPFLPEFGEFRSHYAGFIDSGFGYGAKGELRGATITLEVRSHDTSLTLIDGTPVARLILLRTTEPTNSLYGVHVTSSYQAQRGPRLSRYFTTEGLLPANELIASKNSEQKPSALKQKRKNGFRRD